MRNKAEKISTILDASKKLIEDLNYENITIRDIAREADVSVGLIYKYFPGGKREIIREIGMSMVTELTVYNPDAVDFDDFTGFLRGFFTNNLAYYRKNKRFVTAIIIAALTDESIYEGVEQIDREKIKDIVTFFKSFKGVNLPDGTDSWLFMTKWSSVIKNTMLHHVIYPTPFESDEELIELLMKISLMMWGYKS